MKKATTKEIAVKNKKASTTKKSLNKEGNNFHKIKKVRLNS